jgi:cytochrome b
MSAQPFDPAPRGTAAAGAPRTPVWDLPTRVFHWLLALSFTGACLTRRV